MSTLINSCRRIGRRCRVTWFRTLSWKVTPVWSQDTSVNFIDELFKFIDFLTFQVPDANACSSFLPSHSQGRIPWVIARVQAVVSADPAPADYRFLKAFPMLQFSQGCNRSHKFANEH